MLSDAEINRCFESVMFDLNSEPSREAIGRAIIAADRAKLLAGVDMPKGVAYVRDADVRCFGAEAGESSFTFGRHKDWKHPLYTADQLQQYAAAAAAQARLKALGEAKGVVDSVLGENNISAAIEKLKGGE